MNTTIPDLLREKVEALVTLLDRDVDYLTANLACLDTLRGMVVKRQDQELSRLLDTIRIESERYALHESQRQVLRQEIADLMACDVRELTLSSLAQVLDPPLSHALAQRKGALRELTGRLRAEHLSTRWLLKDCARFNTVLFNTLFHPGQENALTYTVNGTTQRHREQSLMNLQF
ncbi:MAG: hypothetical protein IIA65_00600 [Planctomycetes bacterium]|nr:hypothetical protein [Planctomycetota bacterium]